MALVEVHDEAVTSLHYVLLVLVLVQLLVVQ